MHFKLCFLNAVTAGFYVSEGTV